MAYDSWYCSLPSFISDRISDCIPTSSDQVKIMQGNFGPAANPDLVGQATSDFQDWLSASSYDSTINDLKKQDSNPFNINGVSWTGLLVGIGIIGLVSMLSPGPRRYGR